MTRWTVGFVFVVAELWQLVFGAGTSLALANPRVGASAAWAPNLLVGETYTILPLGFILCLWGAPWARRLAALCAAGSIALALPASAAVSARPLDVTEFLVYVALLAVPGLALMVCVLRMERDSASGAATDLLTPGRAGGGLMILGSAALVYYTVANGPGIIVAAVIFGIGAAVVSAAGPTPLDARLTRFGVGTLALGALSNAAFRVIEGTSQGAPQEGLALFVISLAAIPVGFLTTGLSLTRSPGLPRTVGVTLLVGLLLVSVGEVIGGGLVSPPPMLVVGFAVAILSLVGVGGLALGIPRIQHGLHR